MKMERKLIGIFLLTSVNITIISGNNHHYETYEDAEPIDKESYGLDLSETKLIGPEHPKYTRLLKYENWYDESNADHVIIKAAQENPYAITGDDCNYTQYQTYTETINKLKDHERILNQNPLSEARRILKEFFENYDNSSFTWKEACYHKVNKFQCNQETKKCECYEYENPRKKGSIKISKYFQYDPYTLKHYNNCVIQEKHSCALSRLTASSMQCESDLYCNSQLNCEKISSSISPSSRVRIVGVVESLHFKLYWLLLVIVSLFQKEMSIFTEFADCL